jgi:hypothetical protein
MKIATTIATLSLLFLGQCTSMKQLNGTYSNGNNIEFKFSGSAKEFEYFLKGEMGTLQYSSGKWELEKDKLHLFGFNDSDIKTLDVKSTIKENVGSNGTKIEIHYNTDNAATYIKSLVLVNDSNAYIITKDTILYLVYKVETIQAKSYLSYTGLLSSSPKIDTLYSSKINVGNGNSENKNIILKFAVHPYDFVRVKLTDTLTVKNSRTLYHDKTKLKKSTQ